MRARKIALVIALVSLAVALMAVEPYTDEEALGLWIQVKCTLSEKDVGFSWNDEGFIAAYGRSPAVNCVYKNLDRCSLEEGIVEYTILQDNPRRNMFYLVKVDFSKRSIGELSCMTHQPDQEGPSGYFPPIIVYTFYRVKPKFERQKGWRLLMSSASLFLF